VKNHWNDKLLKTESLSPKINYWHLGILFLLVLFCRTWQITHTEVAARDSIGYIRYAWNLANTSDIVGLMRESHQHPGFPFAIHLFSKPLSYLTGFNQVDAYQFSSQMVSVVFSLAMIFPLYFLFCRLVGEKPGFWGVLIFQTLPATSKVLGDGLSEAMFLFFAACALFFVVKGFQENQRFCFLLGGLFSGISYLVRPEGLIISIAGCLICFVQAIKKDEQLSARFISKIFPLALLLLGTFIVCAPFMMAIGKLTSKPTGQKILETAQEGHPQFLVAGVFQVPVIADWWTGNSQGGFQKILWSARVVIEAYIKGFNYIGSFYLFVGLYVALKAWTNKPEYWFLVVCLIGLNLAFYRVASVAGYLSERHAMLALMILSGWCAMGGDSLQNFLVEKVAHSSKSSHWGSFSWLLFFLVIAFGWKGLETLHYNREGFKQAGNWLSRATLPGDPVDDPYCWSHYHAGRVFVEGRTDLPHSNPRVRYVVVERSKNPHVRLQTFSEKDLVQQGGTVVFEHKSKKKGTPEAIVVYKVIVP
jgi:hypothetical protein